MSSSSRRSFFADALKTMAGAWVTVSGLSLVGCNSCSPAAKYGGPPVEPPVVTKYGGPSMMEPGPDVEPPPDPEGSTPAPAGSSEK